MSKKYKISRLEKARTTLINMENIYESLARRNEQRGTSGWSDIDHGLSLLNRLLNQASKLLSQSGLKSFRKKSKEFFAMKKNIEGLFLVE